MDDSFLFGGMDIRKEFGVQVIAHKTFTAGKRSRKLLIPSKSGLYDFGATEYDEREIEMECRANYLTDEKFDDLKYMLSKKSQLIIWDQPDRRYTGELYDQEVVEEYQGHKVRDFTLVFICEPYGADHDPTVIKSSESTIDMLSDEHKYMGTRKVPTRITIRNTGTKTIKGVQIRALEKR